MPSNINATGLFFVENSPLGHSGYERRQNRKLPERQEMYGPRNCQGISLKYIYSGPMLKNINP
jgi:hypothetical protein